MAAIRPNRSVCQVYAPHKGCVAIGRLVMAGQAKFMKVLRQGPSGFGIY